MVGRWFPWLPATRLISRERRGFPSQCLRKTKGKEPENFSCMGEQWELVELELKKEKREEKPDV